MNIYMIIAIGLSAIFLYLVQRIIVNTDNRIDQPDSREKKARLRTFGIIVMGLGIGLIIIVISGSSNLSKASMKALVFAGLCAFAGSANITFYTYYYNTTLKAFRKIHSDDNIHLIGHFSWKAYSVFITIAIVIAFFTISMARVSEWFMVLTIIGGYASMGVIINGMIILIIAFVFGHFFIFNGTNSSFYKAYSMQVIAYNPLANFAVNYLGSLMILVFAGTSAHMIAYNVASSVIIAMAGDYYFRNVDHTPREMYSQISHYVLMRKLCDFFPRIIELQTDKDWLKEILNSKHTNQFTNSFMRTFIERIDLPDTVNSMKEYNETGFVPMGKDFFEGLAYLDKERALEIFQYTSCINTTEIEVHYEDREIPTPDGITILPIKHPTRAKASYPSNKPIKIYPKEN